MTDRVRLLINDARTQIPGTRTFWHDLEDWFRCTFIGAPFEVLADTAYRVAVYKVGEAPTSLIIRNATYFPPINVDIPTIALLQDIIPDGPLRKQQEAVIRSARKTVYNSEFTRSHYNKVFPVAPADPIDPNGARGRTIPLPVDFSHFEPGNAMGWQQALSLPDRCVLWIGAQTPVKGWDIFLAIARANPDLPFVAVLKDAIPDSFPPNVRCYARVDHEELLGIIRACRVGLCTSRVETQHLAGIEMGACGLPLVATNVGVYWDLKDAPVIVVEPTVQNFSQAIRVALRGDDPKAGGIIWPHDPVQIRAYWKARFDREVVRAAWAALIEEAEACSGAS